MKNIHLQKTDKPSKIGQSVFNKSLHFNPFFYELENESVIPQNLFITSDEEIKEGDWFIRDGSIHKCFRVHKTDVEFLTSIDSVYCGSNTFWSKEFCKKIILTTDSDLIKDGVQAIPDEFLEWYVHNPSCEWVEVEKWSSLAECGYSYHIIIPKEQCTCKIGQPYNNACCKVHGSIPKKEPKQETLEEAAECKSHHSEEDFIRGAKWQAERSYSEEDMKQAFKNGSWVASWSDMGIEMKYDNFETWFEQFKK